MQKEFIMNQEVIGITYLPRDTSIPAKEYFWMKDPEGHIYLVPSKDGIPDFGS